MSSMGGSKGVSNFGYIGSGVHYARGRIGGRVIRVKGVTAFKPGQLCYWSADETVTVTATATTHHDKVAGVVVGGNLTNYQIIEDSAAYNVITVNDANSDVLVQVDGIAYVICAAAIAVGVRLVPDTATAGRVKAATAMDATVDAGGVAVTSSAANGGIVTPTGDSFGFVIGKLIEASGGAAQVKRALLSVQ